MPTFSAVSNRCICGKQLGIDAPISPIVTSRYSTVSLMFFYFNLPECRLTFLCLMLFHGDLLDSEGRLTSLCLMSFHSNLTDSEGRLTSLCLMLYHGDLPASESRLTSVCLMLFHGDWPDSEGRLTSLS